MELNATFKHAKVAIKARPWDPEKQKPGERVYYYDGKDYKPLTPEVWADIVATKARL